MKAVVLEIKNGKAAVLREDGVILEVRGNYRVGQRIDLKENNLFGWKPYLRSVLTAAVLVLALLFGGMYNYTTVQAAGTVSPEEGVGIQLVLNRRSQVIEVRATDESGERMKEQLEERKIKGASLDDAITAVNEVHRKEMEEQNAEYTPLTFRAQSEDERIERKLNERLEEIGSHPDEITPDNTPNQNGTGETIQPERPGQNMNPQEYEPESAPVEIPEEKNSPQENPIHEMTPPEHPVREDMQEGDRENKPQEEVREHPETQSGIPFEREESNEVMPKERAESRAENQPPEDGRQPARNE